MSLEGILRNRRALQIFVHIAGMSLTSLLILLVSRIRLFGLHHVRIVMTLSDLSRSGRHIIAHAVHSCHQLLLMVLLLLLRIRVTLLRWHVRLLTSEHLTMIEWVE